MARRGFFQACWKALRDARAGRAPLAASIQFGEQCLPRLEFLPRGGDSTLAPVYFDCLRRLSDGSGALVLPAEDLAAIATEQSVPVGLVRDLVHELQHTPGLEGAPGYEMPAWQRHGTAVLGTPRPALHKVIMPVLLVSRASDEGTVANLTVEWIEHGSGCFYPATLQGLARLSDLFKGAFDTAMRTIRAEVSWPQDVDLRWGLRLQQEGMVPLDLVGDSLRGAFELALAKLMVQAGVAEARARWPGLDTLKLEGVAVSAGVKTAQAPAEDQGAQPPAAAATSDHAQSCPPPWQEIGRLFEKLLAAARKSFPAIHSVVVAEPQDLSQFNLEKASEWLHRDRGEGFGIMHVLRAANLAEAVKHLTLHQRTRYGGATPTLRPLPPVNIPRRRFKAAIDRFVESNETGFLEITGEMGRGKTTAMIQVLHDQQAAGVVPVFFFIGDGGVDSVNPSEIARSLYQQLSLKYAFEEPEQWSRDYPAQREDSPSLKLAKLLTEISGRLRQLKRKEVLFLEAADQTEGRELGALIPQVLRELPERVLCVVTTRPRRGPYRAPGPAMQEVDFASLVDEREDAERLLRQRGEPLGLPDALIQGILNATQAPVMFTLNDCFRALENGEPDQRERTRQEELRREVAPWLAEPEELVRRELDRILVDLEAGGLGEDQTLETLGLHVAAGSPLSKRQLHALGLWDAAAEKVLKRAKNFFRPAAFGDPSNPFEFYHPGYRREIVRRCLAIETVHGRLAEGCGRCWEAGGNAARGYALRHLPGHRCSAKHWDDLVSVLCDLRFVTARVEAGWVTETVQDHQEAIAALPEAAGARQEGKARAERVGRWTEEMIEYARHWSAARDQREQDPVARPLPGPEKIPLPEVLARAPLWSEAEIREECERIVRVPTRLDRLEAFAQFVGSECYPLIEHGRRPGFTVQHAFNAEPGGPVHAAAEALLPEIDKPLLLRAWPQDAAWNPR